MQRTKFSTEQRAHWRWLLYVILALTGGLLTFAGARAQQRASDDATFRKLIRRLLRRVELRQTPTRQPEYYAKDNSLVFYDIAPFSYQRLEGISRRR